MDRVVSAVEAHRLYFEQIKPVPFLDDTTTKNVMVHNGKLSGIVDVDEVCFGDPLLTVALTRMSLLQGQHELNYIEYWKSFIEPDLNQEAALDIYTAMYCVIFMGEIGQKFNKDSPSPVDPDRIRLYEQILDELLA
ncbi:MAG: hypothetical protein DHS20C20_28310 [Ardenticatenaceae bacterium]|nr:MAG: hypothetical protein DHS20C20_28310 [Ardenticatenaceae bacterium]